MPISADARREIKKRADAEQRDAERAGVRRYQRRKIGARRGTVARRYVVQDATRAWPANLKEATAAGRRGRPVADFVTARHANHYADDINKMRAFGRETKDSWSGDNRRDRKEYARRKITDLLGTGMRMRF